MPSGSHGGSRGSHSSGGSSRSSSGGSHFGSRSSRSSHNMSSNSHYHHGGHHHHHRGRGGLVIVTSGSTGVLFFVSLFMVALIAAFSFVLSNTNSNLAKIETDREYYIDMIEYAESNSDYVKTGMITGKFYNEDCEKWYLTYEIDTYNGGKLEGYTFSVYSDSQIKQYRVWDTMEFAVDSVPVTMGTDSINMDYKNIPLEDDGEYQSIKSDRVIIIIVLVVLPIIEIILIVSAIKQYRKNKKKEEADDSDILKTYPKTTSQPQQTSCPYCKTKMKPGAINCPNCGASFK